MIKPFQKWRLIFEGIAKGATFTIRRLEGEYVIGECSWVGCEVWYKRDYLMLFYEPVRPSLLAEYDRIKLCLA